MPRPDSSVVERGPEKAGVGGSIPSLATTFRRLMAVQRFLVAYGLYKKFITDCIRKYIPNPAGTNPLLLP